MSDLGKKTTERTGLSISNELIADIFRRQDILDETNSISDIEKNNQWSEGAMTYHIKISYEKYTGKEPLTAYLKLEKIGGKEHYRKLIRNEIDFYKEFSSKLNGIIPEQYGGEYDANQAFLILKDHSDGYKSTSYEGLIESYSLAISKLAEIHNIGREYSYEIASEFCPVDYNNINTESIIKRFTCFRELVGDSVSEETCEKVKQIYEYLKANETGINNYLLSSPKTIIHGDFHLNNCLFSKNDDVNDLKILDWQWWGIGQGVYDIAHLLNLYLSHEQKKDEIRLFRNYYEKTKNSSLCEWNEYVFQYYLFSMLNVFKPALYAIDCKLRRKKIFWADMLTGIIQSVENIKMYAEREQINIYDFIK